MQPLGESWDVVEVVRELVTDQQALQEIVAALEARLQVLERGSEPVVQVGDLVAEAKPARAGKK
jgi:hypothetical protein